jgi:hypothetical protein
MKAALCTTCGQVIGPRPRQADWSVWTWCADPCAHTAVRWRDGHKGLLEVTSLHGPEGVVVIGLHNGFIAGLAEKVTEPEWWRSLHDRVTAEHSDGYLFHRSNRDCWAVLVRPGQSGDVFFIPYGDAWPTRPIPPAACDGSFACEAEVHDEDCYAPHAIPPATGGTDG